VTEDKKPPAGSLSAHETRYRRLARECRAKAARADKAHRDLYLWRAEQFERAAREDEGPQNIGALQHD